MNEVVSIKIYVAGPYTAKRENCRGCDHLRLASPEQVCDKGIPITSGGPSIIIPGPDCTEPDVVRRDSNVRAADAAGRAISRRGHTPFVPHKMTYDWERDAVLTYKDFIRIDDEWLRFCDALLYLAPSPGADRELELAKAMGLTIYYSIDEIPDLREPTDASD